MKNAIKEPPEEMFPNLKSLKKFACYAECLRASKEAVSFDDLQPSSFNGKSRQKGNQSKIIFQGKGNREDFFFKVP